MSNPESIESNPSFQNAVFVDVTAEQLEEKAKEKGLKFQSVTTANPKFKDNQEITITLSEAEPVKTIKLILSSETGRLYIDHAEDPDSISNMYLILEICDKMDHVKETERILYRISGGENLDEQTKKNAIVHLEKCNTCRKIWESERKVIKFLQTPEAGLILAKKAASYLHKLGIKNLQTGELEKALQKFRKAAEIKSKTNQNSNNN